MSISLPKLELDVYGTNPANYLKNEKVLIAANCKWLVPDGSPFFVEDIVLSTEAGAVISPSKYKAKGHQYFTDLTGKTGRKVAAFIEINDPTILANNTHLLMTYRSVGKYYVPRNQVEGWMEEIRNAGEGLTYDKILRLPDLFPVNYHIHNAKTEIGDWFELTDFFKMLLGSRLTLDNSIGDMIDAKFNEELATLAGYRDTWHNAIKAHDRTYNNVHGITKAMLDLGLVEDYKTATLSEDLSGASSTLYSTPLGIRSIITDSVNNNVSFLENGVFPISYLKGFTASVLARQLTINPGCTALINGTKYSMPSGTINFSDYVDSLSTAIMFVVATITNGLPVWDIQIADANEADNYNLIAARINVTTTGLAILDVFNPFLIVNHEVSDKLSKTGSIVHSSGLPMEEGVYRIQEQYIQDDPYRT